MQMRRHPTLTSPPEKNVCMISKAYSAHKTVQIASCEPFWPKYNIFDKLCINYANEEASNFDQST